MIGYRIQDRGRDVAELLDPEQQWSFPASGDDAKPWPGAWNSSTVVPCIGG